jgi:hypothetical protein
MKIEETQKLQDLVFKLRQMSDQKLSEALSKPDDLESVKMAGESLGLMSAASILQKFILEMSQQEDTSKKEAV